MKSKSYWDRTFSDRDPFQLPKKLSKGIADAAKRVGEGTCGPGAVRYIWIYVTEDGIHQGRQAADERARLSVDEWLNIIDEAASLGAEWMVVYIGACPAQAPEIWRMCEWAQDAHDLQVGLHLSSACLSEDDIEQLTQLEPKKTCLLAERELHPSFHFLEDRGIRLIEATVRPEDRDTPCTAPKSIACVGVDGRMYTCGLVLGDENYTLGDVHQRGMDGALRDEDRPHAIGEPTTHTAQGCDGCPSHMEKRLKQAGR